VGLALQRQQDEGPVRLGSKRTRREVPAAVDCIRVWRKFGDRMLELQAVAVRLLSAHSTSAASEELVIVGSYEPCRTLIVRHAVCES
jgi:hypothetical protein